MLSRGVAKMATLAELCLPFCCLGGRFISQKKGDIAAELGDAEAAIRVMGGAGARVVPVVGLEGLGGDRCLIVLEKVKPTPGVYPRRPGVPARRPIG